jgi:hypothetical protein
MTRHGRLVMRGWTAAAALDLGVTGSARLQSNLALSQKEHWGDMADKCRHDDDGAVLGTPFALRERARRLQAGRRGWGVRGWGWLGGRGGGGGGGGGGGQVGKARHWNAATGSAGREAGSAR